MEVTNDKLITAFKIKVPLRCYLSGNDETLAEGCPAVAFAIKRYTRALV